MLVFDTNDHMFIGKLSRMPRYLSVVDTIETVTSNNPPVLTRIGSKQLMACKHLATHLSQQLFSALITLLLVIIE